MVIAAQLFAEFAAAVLVIVAVVAWLQPYVVKRPGEEVRTAWQPPPRPTQRCPPPVLHAQPACAAPKAVWRPVLPS